MRIVDPWMISTFSKDATISTACSVTKLMVSVGYVEANSKNASFFLQVAIPANSVGGHHCPIALSASNVLIE